VGSLPSKFPFDRSSFPDLADELIYPRLSEAKLERLAEKGERRRYEPHEVLYDQGVREVPFFVLERGRVKFVDRRPEGNRVIAEADTATFLGDLATFTGEPSLACCIATEPTDAIVFERGELREMLAGWPQFAEMVLETMTARRVWHEENGYGVLRLIAPRESRRAFEVRDLLERNLLPVQTIADTEPEAVEALTAAEVPREETPVLIRNTEVLRNPSAAQVARDLGLRADVDGQRFDLVVLGGGPAGLAASVYGGSEGLRTLVVEEWAPGGQAGTSTRIENYLGFPTGISGTDLTRLATLQAQRFDAVLSSFHRAVELADGPEGLSRVDLDDGQHVLARTVLVSTGARWRELDAEGVGRLTGAGVYHAAMPTDAAAYRGEDVVVVGGGNSAGQAIIHLAPVARSVRVVVRGDGLASTMSRYLVDRIANAPNVELVTGTEVSAAVGNGRLEAVDLRNRGDGSVTREAVSAMFVMIGANPCTDAVTRVLGVDESGYLVCGPKASCHKGNCEWPDGSREPHLLETVRPGVFAAGDVRAGATQRVAGAVGDGALAVRFAHQLLAEV
jgi:thioredoxin reductase (NADPH)